MRETLARRGRPALLLLAAAFLLVLFSGCATSGGANDSARPWGTPRDWEHGMPSGITEGR